jgi:hypothetical protein
MKRMDTQKLPLDYALPTLPPERLSGPGRWLILVLVAVVLVIAGCYALYCWFISPKLGSMMP